jgi:hypothetical protein
MADEAYTKLLERLDKTSKISPDLRQNILAFYKDSAAPESEKARTVLTTLREPAAP